GLRPGEAGRAERPRSAAPGPALSEGARGAAGGAPHVGARWETPYGARSGRDSRALASASLTKRSAFASQVSGRPSFIAIQLTMQALLLRWATVAGAIGALRERTASTQSRWWEIGRASCREREKTWAAARRRQ